MRRFVAAALGVLASFSFLGAASLEAQEIVAGEGIAVKFSGYLQTQGDHTSVDGEPDTDFFIRRARAKFDITLPNNISAVMQADFSDGGPILTDAFVEVPIAGENKVWVGQFKRPFDVFELTSSSRILVIERDGRIRGLSTCSGVGRICSYSRLTSTLRYSNRDVGVMVGDDEGPFTWAASLTNGATANASDANSGKSVTARAGVLVAPSVRLSGNVAMHDYDVAGSTEYGFGFGGDVEVGNCSSLGKCAVENLHLIAGVTAGDNWMNLTGTEPSTFVTAQAIVGYGIAVERGLLTAVQPVFRASWGDPDSDTSSDQGLLITPGLVLHMSKHKLQVNADVYSPSTGDTEFAIRIQSDFVF